MATRRQFGKLVAGAISTSLLPKSSESQPAKVVTPKAPVVGQNKLTVDLTFKTIEETGYDSHFMGVEVNGVHVIPERFDGHETVHLQELPDSEVFLVRQSKDDGSNWQRASEIVTGVPCDGMYTANEDDINFARIEIMTGMPTDDVIVSRLWMIGDGYLAVVSGCVGYRIGEHIVKDALAWCEMSHGTDGFLIAHVSFTRTIADWKQVIEELGDIYPAVKGSSDNFGW
jgi:hypothetical protein